MPQTVLDPTHIMQVGMGFRPSKTVLSAGSSSCSRSSATRSLHGADFAGWCRDAGFRDVEIVPLTGPASAGIALT